MNGKAAGRKDEVGGVRPRTRAQVAREASIERVGGAVRNAGKGISGIDMSLGRIDGGYVQISLAESLGAASKWN